MYRKILIIATLLLTVCNVNVFAHGASIECEKKESYYIKAVYDGGEPMSLAQIKIYSPDNKKEPYEVGQCNENGEYNFTIDKNIKGIWTVQARLAGHGTSLNIEVDENSKVTKTKLSTGQMVLMAACVLWGLFGTYKYYSRR
ncbi:MAG: carboxypeptidase regulatory-like domain-containing protein [Vallitalea sp.]|jgi:nickel transport protein|nr:carboxypeptidase regulatory-like domain-containing protein [Vallitalea sp.]